MSVQRASNEELLKFANAVREAGGANPLEALMPAVPQESEQCLIALNLNFDCKVEGTSDQAEELGLEEFGEAFEDTSSSNGWSMYIGGPRAKKIARAIRKKLGLKFVEREESTEIEIPLPPEIGQAAADFDRLWDILRGHADVADDGLEAYKDLYPLIKASMTETILLNGERRKILGVPPR